MTRTETCTLVTPAKRKRRSSLVLHLSGGSTTCESDNDTVSVLSTTENPEASSSKVKLSRAPIIVNGKLVASNAKFYQCTFAGCTKSYKKPSRLEEHERTHTDERPFVCLICQKTYFRDTHLQAHMRSHQSETSKPFVCSYDGCSKKFWTSQHLKRHQAFHSGEKPFKCTETGCSDSFSKHNQLRAHFAFAHCPPGTKNFRCEHEDCSKSFATAQKLKAHTKTHEDRRYTCSHPTCLQKDDQDFFSTWTALQAHARAAHPPTCPYASCSGKTFTQQKGLRAHLKVHEQREIEEALGTNGGQADDEGDFGLPLKRRRGGEVGRDWKCSEEGCEKDFKSKNALESHIKVAHLRRRDFACCVEGCGAQFGYKHLLQRHTSRAHVPNINSPSEIDSRHEAAGDPPINDALSTNADFIDVLTGKAYEDRTKKRPTAQKHALSCPYPDISTLLVPATNNETSRLSGDRERSSLPRVSVNACAFVFTRAYDLRRHLVSAHGVEVDREEAVALVDAMRRRSK